MERIKVDGETVIELDLTKYDFSFRGDGTGQTLQVVVVEKQGDEG